MATKKIKVPSLKHESIIKLEVSGFFHMMVQDIMMALAQSKPQEFQVALEKLKADKPPVNIFEAEVHLFVVLINSIETAAKEQGLVSENEIEVDDNVVVPTES